MKWIVTGGTGFIGANLVKALEARGDDVVVLSRGDAETKGRVRRVKWDPMQAGPWQKEIDGADFVMHLAGEPIAEGRWTDDRLEKIRSSRTVTTGLVADAIVSAEKKPAVFVSASAVGIYGMRKDDEKLDEASPPGDDVIARICVDWEKAAAPAEAVGVRVVHPRTGIVLGKDHGALAKMLPAFKAFVGGPVGDGTQWVSFIHIADEVAALLFCADTAALSGPVNLTAPNPVTMNDLAAAIAHALHRPNLLRVPKIAAELALGKMAEVVLTGQRVLPKKLLDAGFTFRFPTIEAALQDLLTEG
ncbi:MAG TPA: TIGR01777 family oxidoreductase [Polyangiaceae bacterium]